LTLADAVWGGAVSARLNNNLREDKGYSYGVFSTPVFHTKTGIWRAAGSYHTEKTKESLAELDKELKGMAGERPISAAELSSAKALKVRGYSQSFESFSRVADQVAGLWVFGLPMSDMQRETTELEKTPLSTVNQVAQKYIKPQAAILLLVGDRAKIEAGVRELNLGELVILDVEGKPVSGK
jgi:zinc protease